MLFLSNFYPIFDQKEKKGPENWHLLPEIIIFNFISLQKVQSFGLRLPFEKSLVPPPPLVEARYRPLYSRTSNWPNY